jgi:hypothetical protein
MALGLGFGGAVASIPGTASADASNWLSEVSDFLSSAFPAASGGSGMNLAISIDGKELFQSGTAEAYSGTDHDVAVAHGAGALAYAFGDDSHASVYGTDSTGIAGGMDATSAAGSTNDTAFVSGTDSYGYAGGIDADHSGSYDYAIIFGNNDTALSGADAVGSGSYDGTYVEGSNLATATAQGSDHLFDLVKFYGDGSSSASSAAADMLNGDTSGALADGHTFWADLFPGLDAGGTLADGSGVWADLLSAFDGGGLAADFSNVWADLTTLF